VTVLSVESLYANLAAPVMPLLVKAIGMTLLTKLALENLKYKRRSVSVVRVGSSMK